jgi:hypothetical protein
MFFLLRAAFWLAIVFAWLPWSEDIQAPERAEIAPKAREILGKAVEHVRAGVDKACLNAPAACLEAAASVGRMVAETRGDGKVKAPLDRSASRP